MPRQARTISATNVYHAILRGVNKQQVFEDDEDYIRFLNVLCRQTQPDVDAQGRTFQSDVIFNPNREVTFGLVTAEAMACGTPAIVLRDTAGEEIVDEQTSFVVDIIEGVIDLIPRIRALEKKKMSDACRFRVNELFNAEKQYQKYMDLYNGLID